MTNPQPLAAAREPVPFEVHAAVVKNWIDQTREYAYRSENLWLRCHRLAKIARAYRQQADTDWRRRYDSLPIVMGVALAACVVALVCQVIGG